MANTNFDLQSELFEEFQDQNKNKKEPKREEDNGLFGKAIFRNTKVVVPFDTIVIASIMAIFVAMTFYFLGVYRGKKVTQKTFITVEKTTNFAPDQMVAVSSAENPLSPALGTNAAGDILPPAEAPVEEEPIYPANSANTMTIAAPQDVSPVVAQPSPVASSAVSAQAAVAPSLATTPAAAPAAAPTTSIPAAPAAATGKKYTIQVAASLDGKAAQKEVNLLKSKGYDAFIAPYTASTGKKWFKICVGHYGKSGQAASMVKQLKTKEKRKDCFVTTLAA